MLKEMFQEKTIHLHHGVSVYCKLNSEDKTLPVWILKILRKYNMFALQFFFPESYFGSVGAFLFQRELCERSNEGMELYSGGRWETENRHLCNS